METLRLAELGNFKKLSQRIYHIPSYKTKEFNFPLKLHQYRNSYQLFQISDKKVCKWGRKSPTASFKFSRKWASMDIVSVTWKVPDSTLKIRFKVEHRKTFKRIYFLEFFNKHRGLLYLDKRRCMLPLHIWKAWFGPTRAEAEWSTYNPKKQVFSFITSAEGGDVSELHSRKQCKPTTSWLSWEVISQRSSFESKYRITTRERSSQNSQRTIKVSTCCEVQAREIEQSDNHLGRCIMGHLWILMTTCYSSNHPQQTLCVCSYSKQSPKLWPTDWKLSTKYWFISAVTNGTKANLICKINPYRHLWATTRVTSAGHIEDRFNSSGNTEGPTNNPWESLLCSGKGFPYLLSKRTQMYAHWNLSPATSIRAAYTAPASCLLNISEMGWNTKLLSSWSKTTVGL